MKNNLQCFESLMQREKTLKAEKKKRIRIVASLLPAAACFVVVVCILPTIIIQHFSNGLSKDSVEPGYGIQTGEYSVNNATSNSTYYSLDDSITGKYPTTACSQTEACVDSTKENNEIENSITVSNLPAVMPDDFNIHYETWIGEKNIYDTYEGYIQKDLLLDGTARAALSVDKDIYAQIYTNIRENCLDLITREMTTDVLATEDYYIYCSPMTYYDIKFTANGKTYTVNGNFTASAYVGTDIDAAHFWSFVQYMNDLLHNSEEYKSLPEMNGGYD